VDLSSRVRASELEAHFPGLLASILKSYKKETSRQARLSFQLRGGHPRAANEEG
jgi:hypothetical protein